MTKNKQGILTDAELFEQRLEIKVDTVCAEMKISNIMFAQYILGVTPNNHMPSKELFEWAKDFLKG